MDLGPLVCRHGLQLIICDGQVAKIQVFVDLWQTVQIGGICGVPSSFNYALLDDFLLLKLLFNSDVKFCEVYFLLRGL